MFDFLKGIIIFLTAITLPITGLFTHSKPVKPILTPTPTFSINISPTPKEATPTPDKKIIKNENSNQNNSVLNTPTSNPEIKQEAKYIINTSSPTPTQTPTPLKPVATIVPQIIIPTNTPTPTRVPSPTPALSYKDSHCPKIIKIEDSFGNVSNTIDGLSFFNGSYLEDVKQITITIYATDPQNLPLYYQYGIGNNQAARTGNLTDNNWIKDNKITVDASPIWGCSINPQTGCGTKNISYSVDNQAGYNCSASGVFEYKITRIPQ